MSKLYSADRSDIIWTPAELDLFLHGDAKRSIGPAPRWLARLMITATETGLRPGDLHTLSLSHFQATGKGQRIVIRTAKRKRIVSIPVTPRMQAILDETPGDTPEGRILLNGRGQPYKSQNDMGQAVSRRRDECKIRETEDVAKRPRLYDARGTAATRLFEADASLREIATHMGWSIQHAAKMIETYVALSPDAADGLLDKLARSL
nr:tyrosine-type recombinase/integrase [Mangrovicoccus algicola]